MTTTLNAGLRASQQKAQEDWDYLRHEYEFMRRTMGRDHVEACDRICIRPKTFADLARRRGYQYRP